MTTSGRPRRRLLAVLGAWGVLLVTGAALFPAVFPGSDRALRIGVSANLRSYKGEALRSRVAAIRAAGVDWVREDVDWSEIEAERGSFNWERVDNAVEAAALEGLRVLPIVTYTPSWAGPERAGPPKDYDDFARFTAAAVRRYGPGGDFWRERPELEGSLAPRMFEIWNEPFLPTFWKPQPDASAYARMFAAAVKAGRRANPQARFMLAGAMREDATSWMEEMYRAEPELPELTDALSVHPYAPDGSSPREWDPSSYQRYRQVRRVELIRDAQAEAGDGEDPIWVTEIGWHTAPIEGGVTEREQARYVEETIELARERWGPFVEAVFFYEWDGPESDPQDKEEWFGLARRGGEAKPALERLRRVTGASNRAP